MINSNLTDVFAKEHTMLYAKAGKGAIYVSNGQFMQKISQKDFGHLLAQVDRRRRKHKIELVEKDALIKIADEAKGNFEVSKPYEWDKGNGAMCVFADKIQHFAYSKKYLDIFDGNSNRMFVDDNSTYHFRGHSLVVKDGNGELSGLVLPLALTDESRKELNNVFPLENGFKTTLERIKEIPTNDPYIGKEFFDGRETHIISAIQKINGVDMYVVPTVKNGEVSTHASLIEVGNIEKEIKKWEKSRLDKGKQKPPPVAEQLAEAEKKVQRGTEPPSADKKIKREER